MAQLTVHNAAIHTATVEIKTLTISGKQVTLAVFRQLREEKLFNNDGTPKGVPWGTVNYCPDKSLCDRSWPPHLHVIWQLGDELRRDTVEKPSRRDEEATAWWATFNDLPQLFIAV